MLEGFNSILAVFRDFVLMFLELPFYDTITAGWLIIAIELIGLIVVYFVTRFRR